MQNRAVHPSRRRAPAAMLATLIAVVGCEEPSPRTPFLPAPSTPPTFDTWRPGEPLPDAALVNQFGKPTTLHKEILGHPTLLTFAFSRCKVESACPTTMRQTQAVLADARMKELGLRALTLTIDPTHDQPEVLLAWGERYGATVWNWTLATGDEALLTQKLPSLFNLLALPDDDSIVRHNVKAALISGFRVITVYRDNDFDADQLYTDLFPPPKGPLPAR